MILTKILKPEEFNSVTLARLLYEAQEFGEPPSVEPSVKWGCLDEGMRMLKIDEAQQVLDIMMAQGIIG